MLQFGKEAKKTGKVYVLGRYRSGSSMTQSLFVRNPNAMILFEPEKQMSIKFPSDRVEFKVCLILTVQDYLDLYTAKYVGY